MSEEFIKMTFEDLCVLEENAQLRASLADAQAEIERIKNPWRPIEDAPRDETSVDLWVEFRHPTQGKIMTQFRLADCWYCPEHQAWVRAGLYDEGPELVEGEGVKITHYAPIPAPPGGEK